MYKTDIIYKPVKCVRMCKVVPCLCISCTVWWLCYSPTRCTSQERRSQPEDWI